MKNLPPAQLAEISATTIDHYNAQPEAFWEGTRDHDVTQNIQALLSALPDGVPQRILDLGCGPGRDLAAMRSLGHEVVGLDGSARFCEMARDFSGCTVLHQDFLSLDLGTAQFDGVYANASLFHVPGQEVPRVLGDLYRALRPEGVLFSSNPRGANREGWNGDRYGAYHDLATWRGLVEAAGFEEIEHYYRPKGLPRDQQPWLAGTWRRGSRKGQ
jgi:SAM-dependent methyltransferase